MDEESSDNSQLSLNCSSESRRCPDIRIVLFFFLSSVPSSEKEEKICSSSFVDSSLRKNTVLVNLKPVKFSLKSDEKKTHTHQSISDSFPEIPLRNNNEKIKIADPFSLDDWITKHKENLSQGQPVSLFPDRFQTRVYVIGQGQHMIDCSTGDVWLWQHVRLVFLVSDRTIPSSFSIHRKVIQS